MRVATRQFYKSNIRAMENSYSNISDLQQKISSGKNITNTKDDINISNKVLNLRNKQTLINNYKNNIEYADANLKLSDTVLKEINNLMQDVRNLTLEVGNAIVNEDNCKTIGAQIGEITAQIVNLVNSKNGQGNYLFSGNNNQKPYIKDQNNNYVYQGNNINNKIKISDNLYINANQNAANIFEQTSCIQNLQKLQTAITNGNKDYALHEGLINLDNALVNLNSERSKIGVNLNTLEKSLIENEDYNLYLQSNISKLENTDILKSLSELELNKTLFEATQMSFIKLSNLSLHNKIAI